MQLAGDALTFSHSFCQPVLQLARDADDAEAHHPPKKCGRAEDQQRREPPRLIKSGLDDHAQTGPSLVPNAVVVAGDHAKTIVPRRQMGIERLAPGAGILPI